MADRETVIRGLKICVQCRSPKDCDGCPYEGERTYAVPCGHVLMADALALLKEQEPRVMTREEIKSNYVEIFYFETRAGMLRACVKELSDLPDSSIVYLVCGAVDDTYWRDLGGYGITWRAWTSRPTEEQRKAVLWDAEP